MRQSKFFLPSVLLLLGLSACGSPSDNSFSLSWRLVDAAQADPTTAPSLTCTDAGVSTVRLVLQAQGSPSQPIQVDLDCNLGDGLTAPERGDKYTVLALALDSPARSRS